MPVKHILSQGIEYAPGSAKYIVTLGFTPGEEQGVIGLPAPSIDLFELLASVGLADWEVVSMQEEVRQSLPDRCTIQSVLRTSDGQGGYDETYENTFLDVPCRIAPFSERMRVVLLGDRPVVEAEFILTLPFDQQVDERYRVLHQGQTYEVTSIITSRTYLTARRCALRAVN